MKNCKELIKYFTLTELLLWFFSVIAITVCFFAVKNGNTLSFVASLIGVTSLILNAKGNPIGQFLMIVFSVLYGIISYGYRYYGEMITYLLMTAPMALVALIAWLKNPYKGNLAQVKVNVVSKREWRFALILSAVVTLLFYFILKYFNTANLFFSTLSVTTSFLAVYFTFRRSPYFALFYALNDVVLIVLWMLATISDFSFLSVVVCFIVFLINDLYGFLNWLKMRKLQALNA